MTLRTAFIFLFLLASTSAFCSPPQTESNSSDRLLQLQQSLVRPESSERPRTQLNAILEAPEFSEKTRQATAWERWKQQFGSWLLEHFGRLIKSIAQHPTTTQVVFWAGAIGSLAIVAIYLFRLFRGSRSEIDKVSSTETLAHQSPREWLLAAQLAAERGELDKGIQCSYWAAIVCLQSSGSLPRSGGETPRELLRALRVAGPADSLRSLTAALESFWYARKPATLADFTACLKHAEALGCKRN